MKQSTRIKKATVQQLAMLCFLALLFCANCLQAQEARVGAYFQKIRKNEAELTAFISQMPKGADLHNHYTGAVYAETYIDWMLKADCCVNPQTLEIASPGNCPPAPFVKLSDLRATLGSGGFDAFKQKLIRFWSTKEYDQLHDEVREDHFFSAFGRFGPVSGLNYGVGLQELKERAKAENVSYIELMLPNIKCKAPTPSIPLASNADTLEYYNDLLIRLGQSRDTASLQPVLRYLYARIRQQFLVNETATTVNHFVDSLHQQFVAGDSAFTMRYLAFVTRILDPLTVFKNTVAAFETVRQNSSGNLVGINFVAPEDNPVSMRDYWLHMQFFRFCKARYAEVKFSLHAGELTEGFVKPEELSWHISAAVYQAGAYRIGHGVDLPYEQHNYALLRHMSRHKTAIEINLLSNEFILGVKDSRHPVLLYHRFKVPIVISTDDPGISRTSLTEQYVLLAQRYPKIKYCEMKKFAFNSVEYSFIKDPQVKEGLKKDLARRFGVFERYILENK